MVAPVAIEMIHARIDLIGRSDVLGVFTLLYRAHEILVRIKANHLTQDAISQE
jgi:hypothetical protein